MRNQRFSRRALLQSAATLGSAAAVTGMLPGAAVAASAGKDGNGKDSRVIATDNGSIVETQCGKVRGFTRNGIHTFKGIPYGASTARQKQVHAAAKAGTLVWYPQCALLRARLPPTPA